MLNKGLTIVSCKKHDSCSLFKLKKFTIYANYICYVIDGSGFILIDGVKHCFSPNTCLYLSKGAIVEMCSQKYFHYYLIHYQEITGFIPENKQTFFTASNQSYQVSSTLKALKILRELNRLNAKDCYLTWLKRQANFFELLWTFQSDKEQNDNKIDQSVKLSIEYLHKHYESEIDIGSLHKHAGMAKQSFCRAFKKETGVTPTEYLRNIRMKKAKELLMRPNVYVKNVASMIGYEDELYFSRLFKRIVGQSPTSYRKNNEPKIAVVSKLFLQDHLLSLGVKPVVVPCYPSQFQLSSGIPPYLQHYFTRTKYINVEKTVNVIDVVASEPHYIITTNSRRDYELRLESTGIGVARIESTPVWQDYQRNIAKIIKKEEKAEEVIQEIACAESLGKETLRSVTKLGKWVVMRVIDNQILIHGITNHPASDLIFSGLGFQGYHQLENMHCSNFSIEELLALNPEQILILWSKQADIDRLFQQPLWLKLDAVNYNKVFVPNSHGWDPWGPYGRKNMIASLVNYFLHIK